MKTWPPLRLRSRTAGGATVVLALLTLVLPSSVGAVPPTTLFRESSIRAVQVSPTGRWVIAIVVNGDRHGVAAQRRGDGVTFPVHRSPQPIVDSTWIGPDSLVLSLDPMDLNIPRTATVLHLRLEGEAVVADEVPIIRAGFLVRGLAGLDGIVLWGRRVDHRSVVDRVPIDAVVSGTSFDDLEDHEGTELGRVAEVRTPVFHWVTDSNAVVRAYAAVEFDEAPIYSAGFRAGPSDGWREIWKGKETDDGFFIPMGVTVDGRRLIVVAFGDNDTRGLHELDPETGELTREIFVHPSVDVVGVIFDHDGAEVIGAEYEYGGAKRIEYLDDYAERHLPGVVRRVPGESVRVVSASRDHRYFTLLASGPTEPGTFYYYAKDSDLWTEIAEALPGIESDELVRARIVRAESADGTEVEGFLYLPKGTAPGRPPLVVLPHGGPVGPADGAHFDPLVQYLALRGFAVLQANYRGSGGYGRAFLEAGAGEWGRGIEEDIDAVVQAVLDLGVVDAERACIAGGSYGGYSALISAIQRPHRYRCVATVNGVTDVPLMFQETRMVENAGARKFLEKLLGTTPEKEFERLSALSPVYRVRELQVPVLVVHGTEDEIVDPEHAHRLRAMLEAYGMPYEWMTIRGGHHGFTASQGLRLANKLNHFFHKHLGPTTPHDPDA